ncbi:hypothetical protein niasHS_008392 [Heterodera schachtii]|uniref:Secreted protein n=2 Tax=Heterodera TaxID=34509 RepID=A0ABD2J042_HETSC
MLLCALLYPIIIGVGPPAYLAICQWKDCVDEKPAPGGSHTMICLPATRPAQCPEEAWNQLTELNELEPC